MTLSTASLVYDQHAYTPSTLATAIEDVKAEFQRLGIREADPVILRLGLTDRYVIALIALSEMACCVVPLDPTCPNSVVTDIASMTGATAIFDDTGISLWGSEFQAHSPRYPNSKQSDAAYIYFTSGTTGKPKGVIGTRRGLANRIRWGADQYFSSDVDRCAIKTNPAFVDSLTEILCAYRSGRSMIVAPKPAQRDLALLSNFIGAARIEQCTLTPSSIPTLHLLAGENLLGVQRWILSGEELRHKWLSQIRELSPAAEIINSYGSTEVCGDVTYFILRSIDPVPDVVPIGAAAPGVTVSIDTNNVITPLDIPPGAAPTGELCVGGVQVAEGSLQRGPSADDAKFFEDEAGTRWFRTGDIVGWERGQLRFLGRADDMRKVRGRRIDLAGVATSIEAVEDVQAAHIWVEHHREANSTLRAAVIPNPGSPLTAESVLAEVSGRVPPHLVPDRVDIVPRFHRTHSGKIDPVRTIGTTSGRPPKERFATGLQYVTACVMSEVVGDSDVWPTTSVTDIGLDSLRAVSVAEGLARYFGCEITALDVISARTVAEIAVKIPLLQANTMRSAAHTVRDGPAKQCLLLIHPAIGTCIGYFSLIQHLPFPGPIVFLEQTKQAHSTLSAEGVTALARHYAAQAATLHPDSAFDVAGYSFGAVVAPWLAQELRGLGKTVSSTILIDPAPGTPAMPPTEDWALRRILTDAGYQLPPLDGELCVATAIDIIRQSDGPLGLVPVEQLRHWSDCMCSNIIHCAHNDRLSVDASTLVIRATQTMTKTFEYLAWVEDVRKRASLVEIDCDHFDLLHGGSMIQLAEAISSFLAARGPHA